MSDAVSTGEAVSARDVASLFGERVRAMTWPARHRAPARPGTIGFLGGLPDRTRFPTGAFREMLPDIVGDHDADAFRYVTGPSLPALGEAVAEHHHRRDGVELAPTQIVATNGAAGGIGVATATFVEPGDVVITEDLTYWGAIATFRLAGAHVETVPFDDGGLLDVAALSALLTRLAREGRRVKLLYVGAANQSPMGTTLDHERRVALVEEVRRHGVVVLQDDTYGEIRYDETKFPPSMLAYAPERTVHVGSFSKTVAPGVRVGWVAASAEIADGLAAVRTDIGISPIMQQLVADFVRSGQYDAHVAGGNVFYQSKRDLMMESLAEHCAPHVTWRVPSGGYGVWCALRSGEVGSVEEAAHEEGVRFMGAHLYSPTRVATEGFRLTFSDVSADDIREGTRRLGRALAQASGREGA